MQHNEILKFFADFIQSELGIVYSDHNSFQLQNRLETIAKFLDLPSIEALYEKTKTGFSETAKQLLLDTATNNETSFFRDPKVFRAIETDILGNLAASLAPNEKLRVWSAASSTGQEALSLAMLSRELAAKSANPFSVDILATDISERVLKKAQEARYTQLEVQRGLPTTHLVKYFRKDEQDHWVASPQLTSLIEYKKLNLKSDFTFANKFHLILCRNVLIYQNVEDKIAILDRITANLAPNGYLILGSGESLLGLSSDYDQQISNGAIIYQKKGVRLQAA
ncbi:CheR family methyltransferase [Pseudobdellovibrio exovorus]|uniref:CheR-type methyltransferase domain-containing protein n=1 Tax=Pseudobdellovibrio exovorus JSS TaxID=1184267 RepID=M4V944_9BACT|nr:protein-glutamate O-methyltransferase CheR [Pseudobdellovibrio exovorus]AGH94526.1 hypothetical protein A11Q_306 [Pseudobdellovibrio exovorus JSS]